MSADAQVRSTDHFAIFWGGGLGDILVLRPLLVALAERLDEAPYLFTTARHLEGVLEALDLDVQLQVLPTAPREALRAFRRLGVRFDWIYLGPHPRLKTRLLARVVGAKRIWSVKHPETDVFVGEQVVADVRALGLVDPGSFIAPYGGPWTVPVVKRPREFLVLHPGAKPGWETTRWPPGHWRGLIQRVLGESALDLCLVGTGSEQALLESLASELPTPWRTRVGIETQLSLQGLAGLLSASRGVVCHNSGVLHLSAMLGRPTVAVTGSSARSWRPPYPHVANITSGACELACTQYRCPVPFYRARCIRLLHVDTVMVAVRQKLLSASGR